MWLFNFNAVLKTYFKKLPKNGNFTLTQTLQAALNKVV